MGAFFNVDNLTVLLCQLPFDTSVFGAALKGDGGAAGALLVADEVTKAAASK